LSREAYPGTGSSDFVFRALARRDLIVCRERAVARHHALRSGAVVSMRVRGFQDQGGPAWLLLREKGGKERGV
jgi:hypothetical protein